MKLKALAVIVLTAALYLTVLSCIDDAMQNQRLDFLSRPSHCYLCGGLAYHPPSVLNLATGQMVGLFLYEPKDGDPAQADKGTVRSYITFAHPEQGVSYTTTEEACSAHIEKSNQTINKDLFCHDCRELLHSVADAGYVLVDAYDLNRPAVYPLLTATYTIRDYTIAVTEQDAEYTVVVTAYLSEEGVDKRGFTAANRGRSMGRNHLYGAVHPTNLVYGGQRRP